MNAQLHFILIPANIGSQFLCLPSRKSTIYQCHKSLTIFANISILRDFPRNSSNNYFHAWIFSFTITLTFSSAVACMAHVYYYCSFWQWPWSVIKDNTQLEFCGMDIIKRYFNLLPNRFLLYPDSKVHGANMGSIWGRQDPGGPHAGPVNVAI